MLGNNNLNQTNTTVVNLTDSSNQVIASIKDVTTVKQSQLTLTKLQAHDLIVIAQPMKHTQQIL